MILIPPTHGSAGVKRALSREAVIHGGEEPTRLAMIDSMNRLFQETFGVDVPEAWLEWEVRDTPATGEVEIILMAEAPRRAQTFLDARRGVARTVQVALTTDSRVPIVTSPYSYAIDNPFHRDEHVLVFRGWDGETGLMVFDR